MKPALSIVVPVYNAAPWLCQCLDSLRSQTFSDWEALLIDDGSTDESARICQEYSARDNRFHYWTETHAGVVCARRNGVARAVGDMVGFVDADDWIEPNMYEEMMMAALSGAEAVVCGYVQHLAGTYSSPQTFPMEGVYEGINFENQILNEMLSTKDRSCFDRMPVLWNKLLPTRLVRQTLEGIDGRMRRGEDALCAYTSLLQVRSLVCLGKPLYHYRVHGDSVMGRVGFESYRDTALFYRQLLSVVKHLRPALISQVDSLFLYLISLGAHKNPALLSYPEVKKVLWREWLTGCCREWRRRVLRMRLKSLVAPRPTIQEKQEGYI